MPLESRYSPDIKFPAMIRRDHVEDLDFLFEKPHNIIWMQKHEGRYLRELAQMVPAGQNVVEIGRAEGGSAILLAAATENRVISIDNDPINDERLRDILDSYGLFHVELRVDDSTKCGDVGLLFIDGGHGHETVRLDILNWWDSVVPGGIIAMHDVDPKGLGKGPWDVYNELLASYPVDIIGQIGSLAAVRRRHV